MTEVDVQYPLRDAHGDARHATVVLVSLSDWKGYPEAWAKQTEFTIAARLHDPTRTSEPSIPGEVDLKTLDPAQIGLAISFMKWAPEGSLDPAEEQAKVQKLLDAAEAEQDQDQAQ